MNKRRATSLQPGLCSFQALPEQYKIAFRQGFAHQLPGRFLPAVVNWGAQILHLPFWVMYSLPPILVPIALLNPDSYSYSLDLQHHDIWENLFLLGLIGLSGILILYCAWIAWDGGSSFVRTYQASQLKKNRKYGFGLVLSEEALVARLIDNIGRHNCIWLPREAIADISWHKIREGEDKHSRCVYRTHICYVVKHRGKQKKRWLILKDNMLKTGYKTGAGWLGDARGDRQIFEQLSEWWNNPIK